MDEDRRFHAESDVMVTCLIRESTEQSPSPKPAQVDIHLIRRTWRAMRILHPIVGVQLVARKDVGLAPVKLPASLKGKVDLDTALCYNLLRSEDQIDAWLDARVVDHSGEPRGSCLTVEQEELYEWCRQKPATAAPGSPLNGHVDGAFLHFWPAHGDAPPRVLLEQSHVISDGLGCFTLLDEFLSLLTRNIADRQDTDTFRWGSEARRLPPSVQDAIADAPPTWDLSKDEMKSLKKMNQERINSNSASDKFIDKVGVKIYSMALANNASPNVVRRKVLNAPLRSLVRATVRSGDPMPIGILPPASKSFNGPWTHNEFMTRHLSQNDVGKLLKALRAQKLTLAPFLEAVLAFATSWVRKTRGLAPTKSGWDKSNKVHACFSTPISRRDTLRPQHQRYLGDAMGGFPTQIRATELQWSTETQHDEDDDDAVPTLDGACLDRVYNVSRELSAQYKKGRDEEDWFKMVKATMMDAMETEYLVVENEAYYPSNPWLSSIGRVDQHITMVRPVPESAVSLESIDPSRASLGQLGPASGHQNQRRIHADHARLVVRVGHTQPSVQAYSYGQDGLVIQLAYPPWWYDEEGSSGRAVVRRGKRVKGQSTKNSVRIPWMNTIMAIIAAAVEQGSFL